jgi:hypothetical protein
MIDNQLNIFEFATKELTQDAVFLYLADCYNDEQTHDIGLHFLKEFYKNGFDESKLKHVYPIKQYHKIDVLIVLEFDDYVKLLIIEDKIYSGEHDNQLARYKNLFDADTFGYDKYNIKNKKIDGKCFVYYKPVLYDDNERAYCNNREYYTTSYNNLKPILDSAKNVPILNMFSCYCEKEYSAMAALSMINDLDVLKNYPLDTLMNTMCGQWVLMKALMKKADKDFNIGRMYQGTNYGRSYWTQYRFVFEYRCKDEDWYNLKLNGEIRGKYSYHFRLDRNAAGYYISCNQYVYGEGLAKDGDKKSEFDQISKIAKDCGISHLKKWKEAEETSIWLANFNSVGDLFGIVDEIKKTKEIITKYYKTNHKQNI